MVEIGVATLVLSSVAGNQLIQEAAGVRVRAAAATPASAAAPALLAAPPALSSSS